MDEFGHILREARETKGLSVKDVTEKTRISAKYIEALEQGDYDALPSPVHVRGFLRNYARFLGLDAQPLLDRYEQRLTQKSPYSTTAVLSSSQETKAETLIPQREEQVFFNPVNFEVADGRQQNTEAFLRLVIIIALMVAIGLVINRFLPLLTGNGDGSEAITESITDAIQDLTQDQTATPEITPSPFGTLSAEDQIISTSRNNVDNAVPTASPTRPPLPATMETVRLKLEILERAWMEVTIDGDVVFTGYAKKGDLPYEWEALEEAKVVTGNAIGLFATVNDVPLGRLGGRGESKTEVWRTTN